MEVELKIPPAELVDVNRLRVDGENPNRMGAKQIEALKTSIQRWGFIVPIIANRELLVADGEQRLTVARELGMKQVSVIRLPVEDVDRRLLRQVLNKLRGEHELLADAYEFQRVIESGYEDDLKYLLNLSDTTLERYLSELRGINEPAVPPLTETTITQGDIYQLGVHRLMCGDATNPKDVQALMDGQQADMVFTDPPYGINYLPEGKDHGAKALGRLKGDGDFKQNPRDYPLIKNMIPMLVESCRAGAPIYICTGWSTIGAITDGLWDVGCHVYSVLVWDRKIPRLLPRPQDFIPVNEFIVYGWKKGAQRTYNKNLKGQHTLEQKTTVWRFQTIPGCDMMHVTEKPVILPTNAIRISSHKNAVVLDLFAGSGSTLMACEQINRSCVAMEIDPRYCQVTINRWESYNNEKAVRLN